MNQLSEMSRAFAPTSGAGLVNSVVKHLNLMLNTRRGAVPHLPSYGLPDIHMIHFNMPNYPRDALAEEIRLMIETFEPRLSKVNVVWRDNGQHNARVSYTISATLETPAGRPIQFRTDIDARGLAKTERES